MLIINFIVNSCSYIDKRSWFIHHFTVESSMGNFFAIHKNAIDSENKILSLLLMIIFIVNSYWYIDLWHNGMFIHCPKCLWIKGRCYNVLETAKKKNPPKKKRKKRTYYNISICPPCPSKFHIRFCKTIDFFFF